MGEVSTEMPILKAKVASQGVVAADSGRWRKIPGSIFILRAVQ